MLGEKAMASEIITRKELEDAKVDAKDLGECIHGNETGVVTPRFGDSYPTLPAAVQKIMETGGFEPFLTEAQLKASIPTVTPKAAKALDTGKIWYWDGAWHDTGLSELDQAINYADEQKVQKYQALNRIGVLYEITDAQGNQTWLQVSSTDGLPTPFAKSAIRKSASIDESKLIILKDGALLYCVPDANGNPTALSVRQSDGMFPDFVIADIQSRLTNISPNLDDLQVRPKPSDFQIISSVARGVARHVANKPLPTKKTDFVNSTAQSNRLTFPNTYSDATPLILVICFEGVGDQQLDIRAAYSNVLDHGVLWARCQFHGDSYGSPKAMQDAIELYQKACAIAPIAGVVIVGNSMGGCAALNALTTESIPNILGVYLTDPVCDLRQRYDNGRASEINAAYECDATTYATKTAGYDPMLQHWSKFKGAPISIVATSNDTLVPKALHTDKLLVKLVNHNKISVLDTQAPNHNSPEEFIVTRLIDFINQCASGEVITQI